MAQATHYEETNGSGHQRRFEDKEATREQVPLLVGLMGPSGGGKTFSALRLATGIQRVTGGEIWMIDTEARRGLHYADRFKFRHVEFKAPFGPLDYLAALEHCVSKGARTVIVDSMSHEHEGPGGVLEIHEREKERLGGERNTFPAWARPKAERRRLINSILQMPCNFVFCFRAKEKTKMSTKQEKANGADALVPLGFMPIAGEEFVYEMTLNCLLLPNAGGVPTWRSDEVGERMMIKLPEQFRGLFQQAHPLCEDDGVTLATWAAGDSAKPTEDELNEALASIEMAPAIDALKSTAGEYRSKPWTAAQKKRIKEAIDRRRAELESEREPGSDDT